MRISTTYFFYFQQMEQKKNALANSERFRRRNKEHIQNLVELCNEKTNECDTIRKQCSDFIEMECQLEINVGESFYPSVEQGTRCTPRMGCQSELVFVQVFI